MKNIQKLANTRRQKLMESKHLHEYYRESDELENWINEQMLMANSEDYGQDYEHLLVIFLSFVNYVAKITLYRISFLFFNQFYIFIVYASLT